MTPLAKRAILNGVVFAAVWAALTLLFGNDTWYQLALGALAAGSFGVGAYWLGSRFQQKEQSE